MDPDLEQPAFWSSFHSRLIVAIADTLAPQLRPNYFVEVETRTYTDAPDGELLVDISDAVVLAGIAQSNPTQPESAVTRLVEGQFQPQTVTLPMPTEIKERYLTVREIVSNAVVAVIEVLSPKNKRRGKGRTVYEEKRKKY